MQCTMMSDENKICSPTVSRLVLNTFDPNDDTQDLCAFHIDGDKYNDKLENLEWRERSCIHTLCGTTSRPGSIVIMQSPSMRRIFVSTQKCSDYLKSIGIDVTRHAVSNWCRDRSTRHHFHFYYQDVSKYNYIVPDLPGESWKFLRVTGNERRILNYFVSSHGRIKTITSKGKEYILNPRKACGYSKVIINQCNISVHRLVAKLFIDNPYGYNMVDHIDGDRSNNTAVKLRWVANHKHYWDNPGSRKRASLSKQNKRNILQLNALDGSTIRQWDRAYVIQSELGYRSEYIQLACRKAATAYGYRWKFV